MISHIICLSVPVLKKKEILPFATRWVDLESIMLSEISQTNTVWYHLYVEFKKYNKLVNTVKKQQTHWYIE